MMVLAVLRHSTIAFMLSKAGTAGLKPKIKKATQKSSGSLPPSLNSF